jgi:hypothetical protein
MRRSGSRVTINVTILEGEREGERFIQGMTLGGGEQQEIARRALFASCGVPYEASLVALQNLEGRDAYAKLAEGRCGVEVELWLPPPR